MHIGLLTSDLTSQHGWGNYSLSVLDALKRQGHEVTVVTSSNSQALDSHEIHPLLPTVTPPESALLSKLVLRQRAIRKLLRDCDVLHTTVEYFTPLINLIAEKRPVIMTAHGSYINLPSIQRFPSNWIYTKTFERSHIVCVSHYTEQVAKANFPTAETTVIPNAINTEKFTHVQPRASSVPTIVTLGGVKRRKGTLDLVYAVAEVRKTLPDVQCHVLGSTTGEPGYTRYVRQAIDEYNLDNHVHLHGFVSDDVVLDWYAKADLFALPSINGGWKFEGFGLATLEASAAGLPVIGTRGCGAEDAIDDGVTGLLVSQAHVRDELPKAILSILTDEQKAHQMGAAGRKKATSHTWDDVASQLVTLYQMLLNEKH